MSVDVEILYLTTVGFMHIPIAHLSPTCFFGINKASSSCHGRVSHLMMSWFILSFNSHVFFFQLQANNMGLKFNIHVLLNYIF